MQTNNITDVLSSLGGSNKPAEPAPAQDNTEQVRGDAPIASDNKADMPVSGSDITEYKVLISKDEMEALENYRKDKEVGDKMSNAEKAFEKVPFFNIIYGIIRKVLPPGYGTYAMAGLLMILSVVSALGVDIPYVAIPDEMTGISGIIAAAMWFLRDAQK